jgi:hypothetical protein
MITIMDISNPEKKRKRIWSSWRNIAREKRELKLKRILERKYAPNLLLMHVLGKDTFLNTSF